MILTNITNYLPVRDSHVYYSDHKMTTSLSTPEGEITIRIATVEDSASLLELRLEALAMHPEAFAADVNLTAAEDARVWVERITEYAEKVSAAICIAETGGQLIGMVGIGRGHWPKTRHSGTLWGVYVKPEWRGYHIGEAMVNGCVEWAIENNTTVVYLGVTVSNSTAVQCYTRCGFMEYGIQPKVIFYNGIYYDELLMVKLL
jgi:RimJ/RimL family protein N-acetyltransferase